LDHADISSAKSVGRQMGSSDAYATDTKWRTVLFSIGVITELLSTAAGVCTWLDPFPLIANGEGGYRLNPLEDRVLVGGLLTGLVSVTLGVAGKRVGRVLLIVFGLLLIAFNLLGWLGNHR
jgi:hypothetical protein